MELLMQAEIFSLTGRGRLEVAYWWMGSALNCPVTFTPDQSFIWNVYRIDDQHVALSPQVVDTGLSFPNALPFYASVRDDLGNYLQLQVPNSPDLVTWVREDETLAFHWEDLLVATFRDKTGRCVGVIDALECGAQGLGEDAETHWHEGYRVRSYDLTPSVESLWLVRNVKLTAQPAGQLGASSGDLGTRIQAAALAHGVSVSLDQLAPLLQQL